MCESVTDIELNLTDFNKYNCCCICLEFDNLDFKTNCCNNITHKNCLLTWLIYNFKLECCICRSNLSDVLTKDDFLEYNIDENTTASKKIILIKNLNNILNNFAFDDMALARVDDVIVNSNTENRIHDIHIAIIISFLGVILICLIMMLLLKFKN